MPTHQRHGGRVGSDVASAGAGSDISSEPGDAIGPVILEGWVDSRWNPTVSAL